MKYSERKLFKLFEVLVSAFLEKAKVKGSPSRPRLDQEITSSSKIRSEPVFPPGNAHHQIFDVSEISLTHTQ